MLDAGAGTDRSADTAITALATALERLIAQVTHHLDPDAGEGVGIDDAAWAATHESVVAVARECADVLDDPHVVNVLVPS